MSLLLRRNLHSSRHVSVPKQTYVEDCEICCRPIEVHYVIEDDAVVEFEAQILER